MIKIKRKKLSKKGKKMQKKRQTEDETGREMRGKMAKS